MLNNIDCLAEAIYYEARSEGPYGMYLVAATVHNRVLDTRWPNTYCGVVHQPHQFEYLSVVPNRTMPNKAMRKMSYEIAEIVMSLKVKTQLGQTNFHATWMTPYWANNENMTYLLTYRGHAFYREEE